MYICELKYVLSNRMSFSIRNTLFITLILGMSLASCVSDREYRSLKADYDSIAILNAKMQEDAYITDSIVASVISSFQELSSVENMINVNSMRGELPMRDQARIKQNINILSDKLKESNDAIEMLIKRVESNGANSQRLVGTISILREQLSKQKERVTTIAEETMKKVRDINALESSVNRLREEAERMRGYSLGETNRLKLKEDSLNTVYYAMGTKDDLQAMNLLKNDKVSVDNAELSYLTKSDKRKLHEINMMSKKARLWSVHPRHSYTMRPDNKGYVTLVITDPKAFWEYAQILIAEVDF